jgi:hypothetical protein
MKGASARGVEDPVEGSREDEEGYKVSYFDVDDAIDLNRGQACVASYCEEEDEGS